MYYTDIICCVVSSCTHCITQSRLPYTSHSILPLSFPLYPYRQALSRYGRLIKQEKSTSSNETHSLATKAVHDLTEATSTLLLRGKLDIYQSTRKDIMTGLQKDSTQASDTKESIANNVNPLVEWEYQGKADGQIHGPYTSQQMLEWTRQGYFLGENAVLIRTIQKIAASGEHTKASLHDELLADLEDDNEAVVQPETSRGDWLRSDEVDFAQYS
jgi:GYF domain